MFPGFLKLFLEILIDSFIPLALVIRINKKRVFPASHGLSLLAQGVGRSSENKSGPVLFICSHLFISFFAHPWRPLTSVTSIPVIQKPEKETFFPSLPFQGSPQVGRNPGCHCRFTVTG